MDKLSEAKDFLQKIGISDQLQTDISAYTLLTLANVSSDSEWNTASNNWIRIHDVLGFISKHYGKEYAENTRETIRKSCMHPFRDGALIEDNGKATNSPNYKYRLTDETLYVLKSYGTSDFTKRLDAYHDKYEKLVDKYASKKRMKMMPVYINGKALKFSPGLHNELQKAIIEEFAPRFAPHSECLYVGDTIKKDLIKDSSKLSALGFEITLHDKMPDVVLYREETNWIYFIEAVTSVGPINPKRLLEIQELTKEVKAGKIFVTAFPNKATYKKFSSDLAWETEVWISDTPDHMIHLNGDRFLGPR
ncbi:MAG: hypothetical protein II969_06170 [Anaerolineaceae bacterium]|nr:hypothetical protein [Anaerolineaceae bacterium]